MSSRFLIILTLQAVLWDIAGASLRAATWPSPVEMQTLLKQYLPDVAPPSDSETNTVLYLKSLAPEVLLDPDSPPSGPVLSKTNLYDTTIAYLRVARVDDSLAVALAPALESLTESHPEGIVLDLRYAGGDDFSAAVEAAGLFSFRKSGELRLGDRALPITPRAPTNRPPIVVLINGQTRMAAEALAAGIRGVAVPCLLLGTNTAGKARIYREIPVPGGGAVRVSTGTLRLSNGDLLPASGLPADLDVEIAPRDEVLYFNDEFRRVMDGQRLTNVVSMRLNEAELVRRRWGPRSGPPLASSSGSQSSQPSSPVVEDPVLARAIDLLTGLAEIRSREMGDSR